LKLKSDALASSELKLLASLTLALSEEEIERISSHFHLNLLTTFETRPLHNVRESVRLESPSRSNHHNKPDVRWRRSRLRTASTEQMKVDGFATIAIQSEYLHAISTRTIEYKNHYFRISDIFLTRFEILAIGGFPGFDRSVIVMRRNISVFIHRFWNGSSNPSLNDDQLKHIHFPVVDHCNLNWYACVG
jgi:hypothetical protein